MSNRNASAYKDCPVCGYKNAFHEREVNGKRLFKCFAGCSQEDLAAAILGGRQFQRSEPRPERKDREKLLTEYVLSLWRASMPFENTPVETYLRGRKIDGSPVIRCLSEHLHKPSGTLWPVMLAAVTDYKGRICAVHRTYLAHDGKSKAPVDPAKMTLGPTKGMAIHLGRAAEKMVIAEGIETTLSVMKATELPAWAAISAGGVRNLILPPLPFAREVIIAADNDASGCGQLAAQQAAKRWVQEGRCVRIAMPPVADTDFNDILRAAS